MGVSADDVADEHRVGVDGVQGGETRDALGLSWCVCVCVCACVCERERESVCVCCVLGREEWEEGCGSLTRRLQHWHHTHLCCCW